MSWHWYPCGVFGVKVADLFPKELADEITAVFNAAENYDDEDLVEGREHDSEEPVYKPRYKAVLARYDLNEFEGEPGDFVTRAFRAECDKYIPGYRKMLRYAGFHRVDSDALSCDECNGGDVIFGIGVYQFPLERHFKRAKIPVEFSSKAKMMLWVVGG
jgi:hypothetical protein